MNQNRHRRIGLIGHGHIGRAVAEALLSGKAGEWDLAAVLTRTPSNRGHSLHHADPTTFFKVPVDLYVDCGGPNALALLGQLALERADVWSVSGAALANDDLCSALIATGTRYGHRLRLVAGAAGGLDAVQAFGVDANMTVAVTIVTPERCAEFSTSVRDAASRLPNGVNLAVAIALAGPGIDRTTVRVTPTLDHSAHAISVTARSRYGSFQSTLEPSANTTENCHIVAASLIAALRQASRVIWVG